MQVSFKWLLEPHEIGVWHFQRAKTILYSRDGKSRKLDPPTTPISSVPSIYIDINRAKRDVGPKSGHQMQLPRAARAARGLRRSPWNAKFVVPGLWGKAWDAPRKIGTTDFWHVRYLFVWQQTSWYDMIGTYRNLWQFHVLSSVNIRPICFDLRPSMVFDGRKRWSETGMIWDDLGWSMAESPAGSSFSSRSLKKICERALRVSASART